MSTAVKHHPLSRYLTYCIAIRVNDDDLGESVLLADGPSIPEAKSDGVPLACISETLRYKPENEGTICKVFQRGSLTFYEWLSRADDPVAQHMSASGSFSLLEIDWFTKTSISLAMNFCKQWSTRSTIQLLSNAAQVRSMWFYSSI